jgi:microcystin-dependent protein
MDSFLGTVVPCAFNFPPRGWAQCNGQQLPIAQFTALYSLLGGTYGSDWTQSFALPDLQGRVAMHPGQQEAVAGQQGGRDATWLTLENLPAHTHSIVTGTATATSSPTNAFPGPSGNYSAGATDTTMNALEVGIAGSGLPFSLVKPYTAMNFIIALNGYYPTRD